MTADSKAKILQDAERFILHGKVQQAIGEYLKIISLDPNDVLILNTIGDLYLLQNDNSEANRYFSQVADNYVHNNFFLKAIAVYKKILAADPNNLQINLTMASLYAKQGLSVDARNQYLRVAALFEKDGKTRESLAAYEKIVELDPSNSAVCRKLAELYQTEGAQEKAQAHWTSAARAQVKAGDLPGAMDSYERALRVAPLDVGAMRGFLECCLKMGKPKPALEQLTKAVEMAPQNLDVREMLGRAYLTIGNPEAATKAFQVLVSMDESRCDNFFPVAQALIDKDAYDQTLSLMDAIVPILITRRETEKAARVYKSILQRQPKHIATMTRMAALCSATGDHSSYLEILDQIADYYLSVKNPVEALPYLEKIIQADPESDKHRKLHHQAFMEAYPDTPYVLRVEPKKSSSETGTASVQMDSAASDDGNQSAIVEVDLLLNYGLMDKALSLLQNLETRDPYDKEVRTRLLSLYKTEKKYTEAAEQCLLLAALHRRTKNEEVAQGYLTEAKQLAPDMAAYETELEAFARRNGIVDDAPSGNPSLAGTLNPDEELDLSSDLLDFFSGDQESAGGEDSEPQAIQEVIAEGYPQGAYSQAPSKSIPEQLQEVDFYIRLGFNDEALAKLNEIARISPNNPDLALRYQKLGETEPVTVPQPVVIETYSQPIGHDILKSTPPVDMGDYRQSDIDEALDNRFLKNLPEEIRARQHSEPRPDSFLTAEAAVAPKFENFPLQHAVSFDAAEPNFQVNELFTDLMAEVGSAADGEITAESYEEHFSLGIAYREMDLIEDAIKEFQNALRSVSMPKEDRRTIQCCGMLSTCFLKKGMPRSALRWCQTGLSVSDISSHEAMALRYDMGVAHSMAGSTEWALKCFDQIFSMDPGYRDVAQRIDELKGGSERHASYP